MRDTLLQRWVEQPPAPPNVQYLRDAERKAARELLGAPGRVLDLGSEATLTRELHGDVTRVDFSPTSGRQAKAAIGSGAEHYVVVDPENPRLPFPANVFDAAVSIGPFDWRFLDVDQLIAELYRVLGSGPLVFSVPTPRSPYAATDRNRLRYYEPSAARQLLSPEWQLADRRLLFQYPQPVHGLINRLPDRFQEPFVSGATQATTLIDQLDRWQTASYLVLAGRPMPYQRDLDGALSCLFRSTEANGFWDPDAGTIVRALDWDGRDGDLEWTPDDRVQWRYAPFAIMGSMRWRASPLGDPRHDDRIRDTLASFRDHVQQPSQLEEMPSYGIGPLLTAFSLGAKVFDVPSFERTAWDLFDHSRERFAFDHAEDSLLAYGWAHLYELTDAAVVGSALDEAIWAIVERLDPDAVFTFDNHTTRRHQNQMYTVWGLCKAIEVTGKTGFLDNARRVIERTIDRRMLDSGGFIWEDVSRRRKLRREVERRLGRAPPHWDLLYACHQTFFVTAVAHYYRAGGEERYDEAVRRAMEWIYTTNPWGVDLVEESGIGVPMRGMTVRGDVVPDQRFKGAYEVGAAIMALTELLGGAFRRADSVPTPAKHAPISTAT